MKRYYLLCLVLFSQFNLIFLKNTEDKNYFIVIGMTGVGKSSFINAISQKSELPLNYKEKPETQLFKEVEFVFNKTSFVAIDTPGINDDPLYDFEKIKNFKKLILDHQEDIKAIVIVKKYDHFKLSESFQEIIKLFMDSFPLKNFWEHVIIVNTLANLSDNRERKFFGDEIKNYKNLKEYMNSKGINLPEKIKEYFVDSKKYKGNKKMEEIFDEIKMDISNKEIMFNKKDEKEIKKSKKIDELEWYDIVTLGITYLFRNKTIIEE